MSHSIENCRFRREYEQTRPPQSRSQFNKPFQPRKNNNPSPTPNANTEPKTSSLDEDGLNLVRRFPLPEYDKTIETKPASEIKNQPEREQTEQTQETPEKNDDPFLQALISFAEEMKKSQPPKMYEPTSPEPMTQKEYLMMLHHQNQRMLEKLRAIKK